MTKHTQISQQQTLINKINAMTEFTHNAKDGIKGEPTRLHKSCNPSLLYTNIYDDVYENINGIIVGVQHLGGEYEVLIYQ